MIIPFLIVLFLFSFIAILYLITERIICKNDFEDYNISFKEIMKLFGVEDNGH